ncbi:MULTISPECIES: hypothetical protein [Streptococcus]|uniref:hypothetical protein n=1 Tax=Streptococcus TaxID=1301 RepID=UPI0015620509|nr:MULTISPECIES: hypothetical protein [Streptococcus]MBF9683546.1 hypothetical protein [Streptococcus pseudopneumoniae]MBW8115721.1 hypothetical protein [Streptococcus pseudopneumoniae]
MDIREVLSILENLDDKKDKIAKARTKLEEKRKTITGEKKVLFDNIDSFFEDNATSLEQIAKMSESINLLEKEYDTYFWEAKAAIFEYIFKETKRRAEEKKIYKRYQKKLSIILDAYDEIQALKKDVEEIHKGVVGEITQEHSLEVYRTEVNPTSILPFLNPDVSGHMNFSKEYRKIKEYLGKE